MEATKDRAKQNEVDLSGVLLVIGVKTIGLSGVALHDLSRWA